MRINKEMNRVHSDHRSIQEIITITIIFCVFYYYYYYYSISLSFSFSLSLSLSRGETSINYFVHLGSHRSSSTEHSLLFPISLTDNNNTDKTNQTYSYEFKFDLLVGGSFYEGIFFLGAEQDSATGALLHLFSDI